MHGQQKVTQHVAASQEQNGGFHLFVCNASLILQNAVDKERKKQFTGHAIW